MQKRKRFLPCPFSGLIRHTKTQIFSAARAFSLVELLVSLIVISIVLASIAPIMTKAQTAPMIQQTTAKTQLPVQPLLMITGTTRAILKPKEPRSATGV